MNLSQLQAAMLDAVTQTGTVDARLDLLVIPARGISPEARLDAYRTNVRGVHLEALDVAYPVTREVLGARYWRQLLIQEIPAFESRSPDLHQYGDFLPELIACAQKNRKELAEFSYLGELARLEWQVHLAQFKEPDPDFDWAAFRNLVPNRQMQVGFTLSHALHMMRFSQPVDTLWHSHQGNPQSLPPQSLVTCCVSRKKSFDVTVTRLTDDERTLLEALVAGQSLEDLPTDNSETTVHILHDWIRCGWITGFREKAESLS